MRGATEVRCASIFPAASKLAPPSRDRNTSMLVPEADIATAIVPLRDCVAE